MSSSTTFDHENNLLITLTKSCLSENLILRLNDNISNGATSETKFQSNESKFMSLSLVALSSALSIMTSVVTVQYRVSQ